MGIAGGGVAVASHLGLVWRILCAGASFVAVGVGGIFVFPLLNVCIPNSPRRSLIARDVIRCAFRCIVGSMQATGVLRYQTSGLERLQRGGLLILSNHPTLIDIVFLMAFTKRADCIVKSALWRNPFTRATVKAAGFIRNDDHGLDVIQASVESVRNGNNLIVFPEGTRTGREGAISLKRGAANIAVRALCDVTPVLIRCTPPMLTKGKRWWRLPLRPSRYSIEVKDDIEIRRFVDNAGSPTVAARRLARHLQDYFTKEINAHAVI
jgi:1-acyl-sn-glycerol-3-phosphate acyltransferase